MSRAFGRLAGAVGALIAGVACAQTPPATTPIGSIIAAPSWERRPTSETFARFYPKKAMRDGMAGVAAIRCTVNVEGWLRDCAAISESPEGYGFGEAAVGVSNLFKMSPTTPDGKSVEGGEVTIPLLFFMEGMKLSKQALKDAVWRAAPTSEVTLAARPKGQDDVAGKVVLRCGFVVSGQTRDCAIRSQTPAGRGFGPAALKLANHFVLDFASGDEAMLGRVETDIVVGFPPVGQPQISTAAPRWRRVMSPDAAERLFPAQARSAGVTEGVGSVDCAVSAVGRLTDCKVASEAPSALGFGEAALQASALMWLSPWGDDGLPMDGRRLILPIRLKVEAAAAAKP